MPTPYAYLEDGHQHARRGAHAAGRRLVRVRVVAVTVDVSSDTLKKATWSKDKGATVTVQGEGSLVKSRYVHFS
eukprot:scaffold102402_cov89-Phaeocystis_antarctica.AAC.2